MVQRVRARLRDGPPPDPLPDVYTKCFCSSGVAATVWAGADPSPAGRSSRADVNAGVKATFESAARVSTPRRRRGYVRGRVFAGVGAGDVQKEHGERAWPRVLSLHKEKDAKITSTETGLCVTRDGTVSTGNPGDNTYDKFIMGDCDSAATFRGIDYDVPTRLETTDKSCLQPITGPIVIEGYTGVGMDVVGAGCEDRRKYQWWTLGEQPYDNVWHTSHTH